jgi:hypothetical protein
MCAVLLLNATGDVSVLSWTYERSAVSEFAVLRGIGGDAIMCKACPSGGGDCTSSSATDVVTQAEIVARAAGFRVSPPSSNGSRFYSIAGPSRWRVSAASADTHTRARVRARFSPDGTAICSDFIMYSEFVLKGCHLHHMGWRVHGSSMGRWIDAAALRHMRHRGLVRLHRNRSRSLKFATAANLCSWSNDEAGGHPHHW